jgi:hypothetical protein
MVGRQVARGRQRLLHALGSPALRAGVTNWALPAGPFPALGPQAVNWVDDGSQSLFAKRLRSAKSKGG